MLNHLIGLRREPSPALATTILPLRLFLGATFLYAALDKLTDPAFFSSTAPTSIRQQLSGYVQTGSPLSPLLTGLAIPHANLFGALIALSELWIGMATLVGLLARVAAMGGLLLNLSFYLTSSWTIRPYFLGPDLPYALGWLTLLLAGPTMLSLDEYFFAKVPPARPAPPHPGVPLRHTGRPEYRLVARRSFLGGLGAAVALLVSGGLTGAVARLLTPARNDGAGTVPSTAGFATSAGAGSRALPLGSVLLGSVKALPSNSAMPYTDPGTGRPALLIHLPSGRFVAYSAVCTHAGCTVGYNTEQERLVCPCHGSVYDPRHSAKVVAGPAPRPLAALPVRIDARGNVYAGTAAPAKHASPAN
jgi:thiosulfate dehydrogenase [quinone] large subunit